MSGILHQTRMTRSMQWRGPPDVEVRASPLPINISCVFSAGGRPTYQLYGSYFYLKTLSNCSRHSAAHSIMSRKPSPDEFILIYRENLDGAGVLYSGKLIFEFTTYAWMRIKSLCSYFINKFLYCFQCE